MINKIITMKANNLRKVFQHFIANNFKPSEKLDSIFESETAANLKQSAIKTTVFVNQKMLALILLLMFSINVNLASGSNKKNMDACNVDIVIDSIVNVSHAGCMEGNVTLTPNTVELYSWIVRPTFNLSFIAGDSGGSYIGSGAITLGSFMAGSYVVEIETESGCIGSQTFTINQPTCNTFTINETHTNASVNGSSDGSLAFDFLAGNSCLGNWSFKLLKDGLITFYGNLGEPATIPGTISSSQNNLHAGNYELQISPGGIEIYPSNCIISKNFTITEPPCEMNFTSTVIQPTANSCNNGQISLAITGESANGLYFIKVTSPDNADSYFYASETDGEGIFSLLNLSSGNYLIQVFNNDDFNSLFCFYTDSIEILEPNCTLAITNITANNSIAASCNSGVLNATFMGATCNGYYIAELYLDGNLNGVYYPVSTDNLGLLELSSLAPGNYTLNVNNGAGCAQTQNFTISEPACNIAISSLSSTNLTGFGCNDGTLDVTFIGTTCNSYYIVNLTKDGSLYGSYYPAETSGAGAINPISLPAGNYTIEATNGNVICSATQNFNITEPVCNIAIANFVTNNPTVNIGNNGGVIFNAQGSSCGGNYYYEIYNGGSLQTTGYVAVTGSSSAALISGLVAGNYELKLYSGYGSSCIVNQTFTLTDAPCNVEISGLTANNISSECGNGTINFNASGNTAYGYYNLLIEKDGSYYNSLNITPTGPTTAFSVTDLTVGVYSLTLSDGYSNPCTANATINITQQACNIQINNPVIDEETTSQQAVLASVTGSISGNSCDGNYLVNLIQTDGSVFASQTVPVSNPNFLFENVTAGIYSIKAYPGVVNETCLDQHDFILVDPCPTSSLAFVIDSTGGPCTFSTVHVTVSGSTDPSKLYSVEYRLDGGAWTTAHGPYFGHTGSHTFDMYLSMDGYYEFRSGPLVVLPTCPVISGLSIYKKYCDAYQTSTNVSNAINDCSNGSVNVFFTDPIKCLATIYHAKVYQAGIEVATMLCSPVSGNNYVASAQLPAGSYSYTIYTEGDYTGLDLGCPLNGNFIIGTENCNLSISNETFNNTCNGNDYSAQINGVTCNGSYLVELYKDGLLQSSNPITEYSGTGYISFSSLQTGAYELKVYSNHLSASTCIATKNFDINIAACNLSISNVVVTNAAADLSTFGSVNFDIAGLECSGYQVTILKDGFAYFSNAVPSAGAVTPVSFTSLPPDDYVILLDNGACNVNVPFTVLQGNPTCNLQVNVTNETKPNSGCSNGSITVNMQGNANGNNYILNITKDGNNVFTGGYASSSSVSDVVTNLSAGNYIITLSYTGSGTCISSINYMLNSLPCNLAIANVVATQACDNSNDGEIAFDVTGTICQTSALQLLSNSGTVLVNSTISQSEGRLFENLTVGNYSIQVSTPSGCSVNYPFTIEPQCDLSLFNETVTLEGAGNCTTAKLSYFVNASYCSASLVKLINNTDMTIFYQSNLPNQDGIDANEITDIPLGNYTLQVLNTSGNCSASYNFIVAPAACSNVQFSNVTLGESTMGCSWAFGYDLNLGNCPGSVLTLSKNGNLVNTYLLNSSVSTEISNLSNGNYNLHLYTASGCAIDYPFEVNPVCNLAITNPFLTQACDDYNTGEIAFDLNGDICDNTPMQLLNSAGAILSTQVINIGGNKIFEDLAVGNYSVQVTNAGGCSVNYPFTIDPICDINLFNETVTLDGTGNCTKAKLSYFVNATLCSATIVKLINNTDMTVFYQSNIPNQDGIDANEITDIPLGNYTLQITNNSGNCSASYNFIVEPAPCSNIEFSNVILTESASGCSWSFGYDLNLGNCPGSILTLAKEGNLVSTYFLVSSVSTEISNLSIGNYNLHLTTASGCIIDYPFEITPVCDLAINNINTTNALCGNGTVNFTATGTQCGANNTYFIINDDAPSIPVASGNWLSGTMVSITDLLAGNYTIIVKTNFISDTEFCGDTAHFTIDNILNCDVNITNLTTTNSSCGTGTLQFTINGSQCGATNSYLIVNSAFPDAPYLGTWTSGNLVSFTDLYPGNYILIASTNTTNLNCSDTAYFTINDSFNCNIQIENVFVNNANCNSNGDVSFLVTGNQCSSANLAYIYNTSDMLNPLTTLLWSNGIVSSALNLPEGSYIIKALTNNTGDISNSCFDTVSFSINNQNICNLEAININTHSIACSVNSDVDFTVIGNTCGPVEINVYRVSAPSSLVLNATWQNGMNPLIELSNLSAGMYSIQLSDAISGCVSNTSFAIDEINCDISIINSSISSTGVLYCVNGRIDFDVTGTTCGTGAVALLQNGTVLNTLNWTTGNGAGLHFENMSPGNYSIVAVNNLFNVTCGDTLNFTINSVLPPLSISNVSTSSSGVSSCTSGNVSFVVNGQFCENSFVIVYDESNNFVFSAAYNNGGNQTYNVSGLAPGNYTIEFGLIGYSVTETFTINPNPCNIAVTNVQINYISGSENCTMANVSFTPTGDMCSNGSVFLFRDNIAIDFHLWAMNTAPNLTFNNLATGNYVISAGFGTYGNCVTTYNFEVLPAICNLNISSITSTPSNGSNGTIDVVGAGLYCGVVSYTLDAEISAGNYNNITTNNGNINTQFSGLAPGNYRVTISSAGSTCQEVEYITVTGTACNTNPIISPSSTTVCPGLPVILNSNYLTGNAWSNGGTSFNTNITSAGTYTLNVTEPNGCSGTTSITINAGTNCVPATQMSNGVCGTMNFVKTSSITCIAVSGATQYEWQFSNGSGVYATKITSTNYVLLHSVTPVINWGTNWNIKVRAKIGTNVGPYSADCNIGIMADPTIGGVPLTQLRTQDCGKLNYRINADNRIIANPISGAVQYEFEFSSSTTGMIVATKLQANNVLFLNTVTPSLVFPAQYNVRVRARIGATWGVFGTPCLIGIIGLNREEENTNDATEIIAETTLSNQNYEMMVMPNPFNEQATLIIKSEKDEQVLIEVFDMVGKQVWSNKVQSNTNINFGSDLAQGTYIIKSLSNSGYQAALRFIKIN